MSHIEEAREALGQHFGFADFRAGQRAVIESVLAGHDTIVVMPTGGGKSLCYQLPALMMEGATVVVSPLIALMKDQVDALAARNLPATFINSSLDFDEQKERIAALRRGEYKLIYVAPERFRSAHFVDALRNSRISLFAIDEAHCISHWGHDFRPDYLRLHTAIAEIGAPQVIALTATATPHVREDIIAQLALREPRAFVSGFDRPNLTINVTHTQKDREKIAHIKRLAAEANGGSGIIYAQTRKAVEQVAALLQQAKLNVVAYHAGMDDAARVRAQDDFMSGRKQMIVATNAFGMGIDKRDIRFVVHYHLPGSIEAYYQEIGRAGRDDLPATCALLFNYADKRTQDYFIEGSFPSPEVILSVYRALVGAGERRLDLSTKDIATRAGVRNEMAVQSALVILEKAGHLERGATRENRAAVRLLMSSSRAREAVKDKRRATQQAVLFALLSAYDLSERAETDVETNELAERLSLGAADVRRILAALAAERVISYQPARRTRGVTLLDEKPVQQLRVRQQELAQRAALEQRKLREMISFCYTTDCYRAFILDYFGDDNHPLNCGTCGNCAPEKEAASHSDQAKREPHRPPVIADAATALDKFVRRHAPVALALDDALDKQTALRRAREEAEIAGITATISDDALQVEEARALDDEEMLVVRKILSCVARAQGRYGKNLLAATLRGSRSAKVAQANLDGLSTYGILRDLTQDEILSYMDALVLAGCLDSTSGAYPTISLSTFGGEVMRGREQVRLALSPSAFATSHQARSAAVTTKTTNTVDETYALYAGGTSIEEIAQQRNLTPFTVEKHLADCIQQGRAFDLAAHVAPEDRALIETAISRLGAELLKPLRDALPPHINYRMIRFVLAVQRQNQE